MNKLVFAGLVIVLAVVIIASFFMPWAKASVEPTKVAKDLVASAESTLANSPFAGKFIKGFDRATKAVQDLGDVSIKAKVSGYDIPTLVNKKSSQVAIAILQIIFKDAKGADKKALLVFLLPLLALVCAALAVLGLKKRMAVIAMAVISGAVGIGGLYNLMTVNLSNVLVAVSIESGLWQTMYAYLLICVVSIVWLVMEFRQAKK